MMSPYEGERIFEAEMVRLHQCDRTLYTCASRPADQPPAHRSFWQWLAHGFTSQPAPTRSQTLSTLSGRALD